MLPCLNKSLFGVDCLGCGLQRSILLLFRGDFAGALHMYPAIYTLISLALFLIVNLFITFRFDKQIKIALIALNVLVVVVSYFIKLSNVT